MIGIKININKTKALGGVFVPPELVEPTETFKVLTSSGDYLTDNENNNITYL